MFSSILTFGSKVFLNDNIETGSSECYAAVAPGRVEGDSRMLIDETIPAIWKIKRIIQEIVKTCTTLKLTSSSSINL